MRVLTRTALVTAVTACALRGTSGSLPPEPQREPQTSQGGLSPITAERSTTAAWKFVPSHEPRQYELVNKAIIRLQTDTTQQEAATITVRFSLATDVNQAGNTTTFTGQITQISLQRGSRMANESVRPELLPISFSGSVDNHHLQLHRQELQSSGIPCSDSTETYLTRIANQLNPTPAMLEKNQSWRDSLTATGCYGSIPVSGTMIRHYRVAGEAAIPKQHGLLVERLDSIHVVGEGSQGQHRVEIESTSTGSTHLFLDLQTGQLMNSGSELFANVLTRASGRETRFTQSTNETVQLLR